MGFTVIDSSVVQSFFNLIKGSVGAIVTIILPVFGVICAVYLIIRIVKAFTHAR